MPLKELPINGPTYNNRCRSVSGQLLQNMYPELNHGRVSVYQFPGVGSAWCSTAGDGCRGMKFLDGVLYKVTGETLYSVDSLGVATSLGVIAGKNPVVMDHDGDDLIIATGGTTYKYDGSILSTLNTFTGASSVTVLNQQAIYDGTGGTMSIANAGDPGSLKGAVTAEAVADDIQCVQSYMKVLLGFGDRSIEPWWNSRTTGTGFSPYQNSLIKPGIAGPYALAQDHEHLYYIGSNMLPYRLNGLTKQYIGNPAIAYEWSGHSPINARVSFLELDGQVMIYYSFPSSNKSYMYHRDTNTWATMASGNSGGTIHPMFDYAYAYSKHLVSDRNNGNIYELDWSVFGYAGDTIQWKRITADIDGSMFGLTKYDKLRMGCLYLDVSVGRGLSTGQGSEPKITIEYSDNYGETWSNQNFLSVGEIGDYGLQVKIDKTPDFYKRRFRMIHTDPTELCLMGMYADIGKA